MISLKGRNYILFILCNFGAYSDLTIPQGSKILDVYHNFIVKFQPFVMKANKGGDSILSIGLTNLASLSKQHYWNPVFLTEGQFTKFILRKQKTQG